MCIFANLNTITRGLSYRVGHLQQYYEVLLICQSTKAYHLQLCILFIQKLPSISRQIKIRGYLELSRKNMDQLPIFLVNVSNVDSYLNNSPSYSRQPTAPIGSGVFPYQYKSRVGNYCCVLLETIMSTPRDYVIVVKQSGTGRSFDSVHF